MDLESFTWPNPISRPAGLQELVKASVHFNRNNNSCGAPLAVIAMAKRMVWCFSFSHVACWSFWRSPNWLLFTVFSFVQIFFSNSLQAECLLGHYFKWLPKYIDIRNTLFFLLSEYVHTWMKKHIPRSTPKQLPVWTWTIYPTSRAMSQNLPTRWRTKNWRRVGVQGWFFGVLFISIVGGLTQILGVVTHIFKA